MRYLLIKDEDETLDLKIEETGTHTYKVTLGDQEHLVDVRCFGRDTYSLLVDGLSLEASVLEHEHHKYDVHMRDGAYPFRIVSPLQLATEGADLGTQGEAGAVLSPMPAKVVKVMVAVGDQVQQDQPLMILEAMKMQNELLAPCAGVVEELNAIEGQAVEGHALLVFISSGEPE